MLLEPMLLDIMLQCHYYVKVRRPEVDWKVINFDKIWLTELPSERSPTQEKFLKTFFFCKKFPNLGLLAFTKLRLSFLPSNI